MGALRGLGIIALLVMLTPGAVELAENLGHLVSHGDLPHVGQVNGDHVPAGPEHGCNGTFHMCSCHASPSFLAESTVAALDLWIPADGIAGANHRTTLVGFRIRLKHPPRT